MIKRDSKGRFVKGSKPVNGFNKRSLKYWLGKHLSKEHKAKISEIKKNKYATGEIKSWNKGLRYEMPNARKKHNITEEVRKRMSDSAKKRIGSKHPRWKGGKDSYYSRLARKTIERVSKIKWPDMYKPTDSVIHHINEDRTNNNFDNLCVMSREDHGKLHRGKMT